MVHYDPRYARFLAGANEGIDISLVSVTGGQWLVKQEPGAPSADHTCETAPRARTADTSAEGASCLALRDEGGSACESEWQTFEARAVDCHYASELATHSCNWTCIKRRRPCVDVKASRAEQSAKVGDMLDLIPVILDAHGGIGRTKELCAKCWTE